MSFHQLFKSYRGLRRNMRQSGKKQDEDSMSEIKKLGQEIADELRKMIDPLIILRSRLALDKIEIYKLKNKKNKI